MNTHTPFFSYDSIMDLIFFFSTFPYHFFPKYHFHSNYKIHLHKKKDFYKYRYRDFSVIPIISILRCILLILIIL